MWTQNSVGAAHLKSEIFLWSRHYSASIFNVSICTITAVQIEMIIKKLSHLLKKTFTSENTFLQCIAGMAGEGARMGRLARVPSKASLCLISGAVLPVSVPCFGCLLQVVVPSGLLAASVESIIVSLNTCGSG